MYGIKTPKDLIVRPERNGSGGSSGSPSRSKKNPKHNNLFLPTSPPRSRQSSPRPSVSGSGHTDDTIYTDFLCTTDSTDSIMSPRSNSASACESMPIHISFCHNDHIEEENIALKEAIEEYKQQIRDVDQFSRHLMSAVRLHTEKRRKVRQAALRLQITRFHSLDDNLWDYPASCSLEERRAAFFNAKRRTTKKAASKRAASPHNSKIRQSRSSSGGALKNKAAYPRGVALPRLPKSQSMQVTGTERQTRTNSAPKTTREYGHKRRDYRRRRETDRVRPGPTRRRSQTMDAGSPSKRPASPHKPTETFQYGLPVRLTSPRRVRMLSADSAPRSPRHQHNGSAHCLLCEYRPPA